MLWANRKQTQSVTFTEDAADQTLLDAIETELSQAKYQTFSNLCKQALWQFLLISRSESPTPPSANSTPNPPQVLPNLQRVEERLFEIQNKLTDLEKKVLTEEGTPTDRLDVQLHQLTQQMTQLQISINQKLTDIATGLEAVQSQPQSIPVIVTESNPFPPEPEPVSKESMEEADPLLQRLGSLLDDF
ncbi:hypothetical protein [Planktothrix mougeotii]|uniref:Plasmid segregation centromere-binding protein ParR n=1 Tax=Planktothrix mougeotii LEGE 06226 TaxID=1828728 RepID=A0ABR9U775_9CYAN|nr:hypothetical protein [Planktothrix mougeotii]MBE9142287.1 hypothetical protein [Planktothrix mougeotii LEGE 06226]